MKSWQFDSNIRSLVEVLVEAPLEIPPSLMIPSSLDGSNRDAAPLSKWVDAAV